MEVFYVQYELLCESALIAYIFLNISVENLDIHKIFLEIITIFYDYLEILQASIYWLFVDDKSQNITKNNGK